MTSTIQIGTFMTDEQQTGRFIGFVDADGRSVSDDAWFVGDWFDAEGRYIGPDADGIEPVFA